MCSDGERERVICAAIARAHEEQQKMKDEKARLMCSEGIYRPIPGSEKSIQVKTAKKIRRRSPKNNLNGLREVFSPKSTVGKVGPTTSIIKEPNKPTRPQFGYSQAWHKARTRQ